jgi:VCBS repeat-containing protein
VTALVRDGDQAEIVAARGATPAVVNLYDRPRVVSLFRYADAAVHTASPGDATSADLDSAVVDAAIDAYAGTGKAYIEISGQWVYGANAAEPSSTGLHPAQDSSRSSAMGVTATDARRRAAPVVETHGSGG